jgi:hypothetical protein
MSVTPSGASSGDGTYIRGGGTRAGGGAHIDPRVLAAILIWLLVGVLAALAIYFAVAGSRESSRLSTLRHRGVPVTGTVTGCVGISSGVGMGIEYWQCRASYTLAGQTFSAVINGSRGLLETGQRVGAIAVPGEPSLLSTVSSVHGSGSSETDSVIAAVLGAVAVVVGAGWLQLERARRRRQRKG